MIERDKVCPKLVFMSRFSEGEYVRIVVDIPGIDRGILGVILTVFENEVEVAYEVDLRRSSFPKFNAVTLPLMLQEHELIPATAAEILAEEVRSNIHYRIFARAGHSKISKPNIAASTQPIPVLSKISKAPKDGDWLKILFLLFLLYSMLKPREPKDKSIQILIWLVVALLLLVFIALLFGH